jgi:hypothetical protein
MYLWTVVWQTEIEIEIVWNVVARITPKTPYGLARYLRDRKIPRGKDPTNAFVDGKVQIVLNPGCVAPGRATATHEQAITSRSSIDTVVSLRARPPIACGSKGRGNILGWPDFRPERLLRNLVD